eukprot:sb/3479363/
MSLNRGPTIYECGIYFRHVTHVCICCVYFLGIEDTSHSKPDIIVINETWLKPSINSSSVVPLTYTVYRLDRSHETHPFDPSDPKRQGDLKSTLAELYMSTGGDAKMTLYKTAEASRNKAFISVLNEKIADKKSDKVIEAVRNINRKGLPIAEEIYQALSSFISEPREALDDWANASRDALYIFLERGKLRVSAESQTKRLNDVIIKFLKALRDLDCEIESVKEVVAEVTQDVIGLAEDTVFFSILTDDQITLVMDLFAKYGTWFTKFFRKLPASRSQSILWKISTHPLLKSSGVREIYNLRQDLHSKKLWDFGPVKAFRRDKMILKLSNLRETSPNDYLAKLSEFFLQIAISGPYFEASCLVRSVCEVIDLRESDSPELLLRLFLCLVRFLQTAQTKFRVDPNTEHSPKKGQVNGKTLPPSKEIQVNETVRILGEDGAPGVEVTEQDLSSPILKSMLASSFEEGRTRTITVPSAPQRILEAIKLILGENGEGVEEHATLKEVCEWLLPWSTMYQVDEVFFYLVEAMSRDNRSQNSMLSDDWLVEFVIRSKHPAWLMLVPDRFVLVESLNLPSRDLIHAITELINAVKNTDNYLVNIISYCIYHLFDDFEDVFLPDTILEIRNCEEYKTPFMTEPPAKRRARCIESYCEDLRGLLVKSPDLWDFKAIQKVLSDIFRLYYKSSEMIKDLKNSTFPYSIPILISRRNLHPSVINSLLKILIEMKSYDNIYSKECYRSFVIDNFLPVPACYLQSLRFINMKECSGKGPYFAPFSALQEVSHYLERKMKSKKNLPKDDRLIYSELAKMIGNFGYAIVKRDESVVLLVSVAELNSKLHCLDGDTAISLAKMVLSYIDIKHDIVGRLKETLGDLVEEICVLCPGNLAELYMSTGGDAKMTLYKTAEASRNKVFVSVLNERVADKRSDKVIEAVRNINRKGFPIAEEIYQALDTRIKEPREPLEELANLSRDALYIFLERGKLRVTEESKEKRLNEVLIKMLEALRKHIELELDTVVQELEKEVVRKVVRGVVGLAEDTVFRHEHCNSVWANIGKGQLSALERLQKRAVKWIKNEPLVSYTNEQYVTYLKELDLLPFKQLFEYSDLRLFYKVVHNHVPLSLPPCFTLVDGLNLRLTRQNQAIIQGLDSTTYKDDTSWGWQGALRDNFYHRTTRLWNDVPYTIRQAVSQPVYLRKLKIYLFESVDPNNLF